MSYRDNGAIGALLDEYQKAISELISVTSNISHPELINIVDAETDDPDCRSIQTILAHVIESGFTYSIEIYKHLGVDKPYRNKIILDSTEAYNKSLLEMFSYCETLFSEIKNIQLVEKDPAKKIKVRWGQFYDIDQLMEHAIVHILRHRRQIERFILRLR